jgi:small subunit ribosomal protein S4e
MSKHLKRLAAPRVIRIHKKERTWTIRPSPGPHLLERSIPLGIIVRDYLYLSDNLAETKRIISNGEMFVDGIKRTDYKFPCGLMDIITCFTLKKDYRILFDTRGKLTLVPIQSKEANWKLCRIENKTVIKNKQTQINLHDGRNKIIKKDDYNTGDVLKISFNEQKIEDIYKFEKGTISMIIGGSHIGEIANIESIEIIPTSKSNLVKMKGKSDFVTLQEYVFPIGKSKPEIELVEVKIK